VSEVVRLILVSHAMTEATAAGRFPADEPLSDLGRRRAGEHLATDAARQLCGPERRTRETADALGLRPATEPLLADLDCGLWRGRALDEVDSEDLEVWLTDPRRAPHGGESIADVIGRVAGWLATLTGPTVAVTHPAVIRAAIVLALDAPPKSFWRIDIAPAGRVVMHLRQGRWTLRL
jgi:broad specificity phosphatase PhoE